MKKTLFILFILAAFIGCVKDEDESDAPLAEGYTTISGKATILNCKHFFLGGLNQNKRIIVTNS